MVEATAATAASMTHPSSTGCEHNRDVGRSIIPAVGISFYWLKRPHPGGRGVPAPEHEAPPHRVLLEHHRHVGAGHLPGRLDEALLTGEEPAVDHGHVHLEHRPLGELRAVALDVAHLEGEG